MVLKFKGVESISDAELLVGVELQVPEEQRAELEAGAAYVSDLVGCEVLVHTADGLAAIGTVTDVQFGAGEAPLLVVKGEREYLVPYAEAFLKATDFRGDGLRWSCPKDCWRRRLR